MGIYTEAENELMRHVEYMLNITTMQTLSRMLSCFSRVQLCDSVDGSLPGSSVHGGSPNFCFFYTRFESEGETSMVIVSLWVSGLDIVK